MENQHRKISGYRDFNQSEIDLINEIKQKGVEIGDLIDRIADVADVDKRWMSIGKTDIQKGFMSLIRSIAKPETF